MIKTAIMQPYIFPYLGYYQLINAVDTFVIFDDVHFIMRSWINRNNTLIDNKIHLFSISLDKPSQNKLICETKLNFPIKEREKLLKTFQLAYKKAPYFNAFYTILEDIILFEDDDLTKFLCNSLFKTCDYVGINTKFLLSSKINKDNSLKAEDRIIEICKQLKTELYINPIGGKSLYNKENFEKEKIELKFINTKSENIFYKQFNDKFIANLSFLDVIMFNSKEDIMKLLNEYTLIEG